MSLSLGSCAAPTSESAKNSEIVAWVGKQPIYASVVARIAKQKGLDQERALEHAADILRLYLAYQEQETPESHTEELEQFLRLQGAVRVWLQDSFEANHVPDLIPQSSVSKTLKQAEQKNRPFGPKLHGLCQIIVRPKDAEANPDARAIPDFERVARKLVADTETNLQRALPELEGSERCKLFDQLTELIAAKRPPKLVLKRESLLIDLSSQQWDQIFVNRVAPATKAQLLPPFMTRFGLHLVYVSQVLAPHLPANDDGSIRPATKIEREKEMRELMLDRWRSKELKTLLESLRKRELIEWN